MDVELNLSVVDLIYALVLEQMFQEYQKIDTLLGYATFFFTFWIYIFFYFEYRDWNARLKNKQDEIKKPILINILTDIILLFVAYQLVVTLSGPIELYYTWFIYFLLVGVAYHLIRMILYWEDYQLMRLNLFDLSRDFLSFIILFVIKLVNLNLSDWVYFWILFGTFIVSLLINLVLTRNLTKKTKTEKEGK